MGRDGASASRLGLAWVLLLLAPLACAGDNGDTATYAPVDPAVLEGPTYYDVARFPGIGRSAFHPDAELPAPVRAVLMVDAHEGELPHARYRVRYHLAPGARDGDAPRAEVEVVRLNMGPWVRDGLIAADPALPIAAAEEFGTGPHVGWRFAMGPVQGMEAAVTRAERREIDDAEAHQLTCLDMPCFELAPGPGGDWEPIPAALPALPFDSDRGEDPEAAAVIAFLLDALGEDALLPMPRADTHRFEFVLSRNTDGQDRTSLALGRDAIVLDDAIGTLWVRWREVGQGPPDASRLPVARQREIAKW